jgi:uncharacterized protein YcfJ
MRSIVITAGLLVALAGFAATPADAAGCLKGAVVGGIAGHYVGHHGLVGAGAGCLIGRHAENRRAREQVQQNPRYDTTYRTR